jgi:C-terminal region of aryl-sulfatase
VNNLDNWTGKRETSARDEFMYYFDSKLMAVRMGPWKFHFTTREDYYDDLRPRAQPLMFNLRSDPNESYDNKDAAGHLEQRASWLFQPMSERVRAHLGTLIQYPPVQGGTSLDMNKAVEEALRQAKRE